MNLCLCNQMCNVFSPLCSIWCALCNVNVDSVQFVHYCLDAVVRVIGERKVASIFQPSQNRAYSDTLVSPDLFF